MAGERNHRGASEVAGLARKTVDRRCPHEVTGEEREEHGFQRWAEGMREMHLV